MLKAYGHEVFSFLLIISGNESDTASYNQAIVFHDGGEDIFLENRGCLGFLHNPDGLFEGRFYNLQLSADLCSCVAQQSVCMVYGIFRYLLPAVIIEQHHDADKNYQRERQHINA